MAGRVRIGISGWTYKPWRGVFYPGGLPQKKELQFAAAQFPTIEINGTFYSLQRPSSFAQWVEQTPDDFVFAVKGSRYITHMLRLRNVEQPLANLFASGLLRLGHKLGPMLWQFPPNFQFNETNQALLKQFFDLLPQDTGAASALARQHDSRLAGRTWIGGNGIAANGAEASGGKPLRIRHAVEIRHPSFVCAEFVTLLRSYNVALVCADTVEWPRLMDITADFAYCRLHGSEVLYTSGYGEQAIEAWAGRVAAWARGEEVKDGDHAYPTAGGQSAEAKSRRRDVYVYFDNDAKVFAPRDAHALAARVQQLLQA